MSKAITAYSAALEQKIATLQEKAKHAHELTCQAVAQARRQVHSAQATLDAAQDAMCAAAAAAAVAARLAAEYGN